MSLYSPEDPEVIKAKSKAIEGQQMRAPKNPVAVTRQARAKRPQRQVEGLRFAETPSYQDLHNIIKQMLSEYQTRAQGSKNA